MQSYPADICQHLVNRMKERAIAENAHEDLLDIVIPWGGDAQMQFDPRRPRMALIPRVIAWKLQVFTTVFVWGVLVPTRIWRRGKALSA